MDRRPEPQLIAPGASPEEVAAIAGALEMDLGRSLAPDRESEQRPPEHAEDQEQSTWLGAALREGVDRGRICE